MNILVTGCAGFIGFHLCLKLLQSSKIQVSGIDNLNNYYDVKLKKNRLKILSKKTQFKFHKLSIDKDYKKIALLFKKNKFDIVINLAAQAGVRFSIENPKQYLDSNIIGFYNIIELSAKNKIKHLLFASTSSVYGNNKNFPTDENQNTDLPLSFYAASKKCNEVIAASFSNIYKLPCTGMRFFTVYGPYGRPDMSLFKFTDSILKSKKISLFNFGKHVRDFTYIDDIVNSLIKLIDKPPKYSKKETPYQILNIGSSSPIKLIKFLNIIEKHLNKKASISYKDLQKGDVYKTFADNKKLKYTIGKINFTTIDKGVSNFIKWFNSYYKN